MPACLPGIGRRILRCWRPAPYPSKMDDENTKGPKHPEEFDTVRTDKPLLVFNRYELLNELGKGGTGVVWLARDLELNTNVALKLLREDVTFEVDALRELKGEIILNRDLSHPHIIKTYSFETSGQKAAISMEHVSGDNLQTLKAKQPGKFFEVKDISRWMQMLCDAMDYAHRQHVVHRDIKPSNLMVNKHGDLKVGDFGIGRAVAETVNRMTKNAAGTPPYMSPQQTMGEKAVPSDDIYSIGATIYDLLTGSPPFFRGAIREQALAKVPPSMAQRRVELERAGTPIPPHWEKTVAACLAKEPAARPPTARALRAMLENHGATSVLSGYPLARRGMRGIDWAITGVIVLAITGGVICWNDPRQAERVRDALVRLKAWGEQKFAGEPVRPIKAALQELPQDIEAPKSPEPKTIARDPFGEKVGPLLATGSVAVLEVEWLRAALKGEKGEGEKLLAERLLELKSITVGQWRARTAYDYSLPEEVLLEAARLPPALDLPVNEWTKIRLLRMDAGTFFAVRRRRSWDGDPTNFRPKGSRLRSPFSSEFLR